MPPRRASAMSAALTCTMCAAVSAGVSKPNPCSRSIGRTPWRDSDRVDLRAATRAATSRCPHRARRPAWRCAQGFIGEVARAQRSKRGRDGGMVPVLVAELEGARQIFGRRSAPRAGLRDRQPDERAHPLRRGARGPPPGKVAGGAKTGRAGLQHLAPCAAARASAAACGAGPRGPARAPHPRPRVHQARQQQVLRALHSTTADRRFRRAGARQQVEQFGRRAPSECDFRGPRRARVMGTIQRTSMLKSAATAGIAQVYRLIARSEA